MDALARFRKNAGNSSTMVHWGNVEATGMAGGASSGQTGFIRKDKWGKITNMPADVTDKAVKALKKGACMCDTMDTLADDIAQHPLARLHWEQLMSQRPMSKKLQLPSVCPSMEAKKIFEEERFAEGSKKYAYKYKYHCTQCGSDWEVMHDYYLNEDTGAQVEGFRTYRAVAGV